MPSPRTIGIGFTLACADQEKIEWRFVNATISAAVMVSGTMSVVVMGESYRFHAPAQRIADRLDEAKRLLDEVYSIGVWVTSDDSSDNRRRRELLREVDWAVSGALRTVADLPPGPAIEPLRRDLEALVRIVEPLPGTVSDIMGDTLALDSAILDVTERLAAIREQVEPLLS